MFRFVLLSPSPSSPYRRHRGSLRRWWRSRWPRGRRETLQTPSRAGDSIMHGFQVHYRTTTRRLGLQSRAIRPVLIRCSPDTSADSAGLMMAVTVACGLGRRILADAIRHLKRHLHSGLFHRFDFFFSKINRVVEESKLAPMSRAANRVLKLSFKSFNFQIDNPIQSGKKKSFGVRFLYERCSAMHARAFIPKQRSEKQASSCDFFHWIQDFLCRNVKFWDREISLITKDILILHKVL